MAKDESDDDQKSNRDHLVDTYLDEVASRGYENVGVNTLAKSSGLRLSEIRAEFSSPYGILAEYARRVDRQLLDTIPQELMDDSPRERLFDVMMMRFDILGEHKDALAEMYAETSGNPIALASWNRIALISMSWMMSGVGLEPRGADGIARAQALVLVFARTFRVWLQDDDPGMARTMAELDKRLREAERFASLFNNFGNLLRPFQLLRRRRDRFPTAEDGYSDDWDRPSRSEMH